MRVIDNAVGISTSADGESEKAVWEIENRRDQYNPRSGRTDDQFLSADKPHSNSQSNYHL